MQTSQPFWQTLLAGAVGGFLAIIAALLSAVAAWRLQRRSTAQDDARRHRAAVQAVYQELAGVAHVVSLMLNNGSVMLVPATDVAYRAMGRELLSGLPDDTITRVVKAYTHMPLLINAVDYADRESKQLQSQTSPRGQLSDGSARQIRILAEDVDAAVLAIGAHMRAIGLDEL